MLYETISKDLVNAMKNKDTATLSTLRLLKGAIDLYIINNKMDRHENVPDDIVIDVISKQIKTHKESIIEFEKGNRKDLVDSLLKEIEVLSVYLPQQLSEDEINENIDEVFNKLKPSGIKDMGNIMKELNPIFKGRVDMKAVTETIRNKLVN